MRCGYISKQVIVIITVNPFISLNTHTKAPLVWKCLRDRKVQGMRIKLTPLQPEPACGRSLKTGLLSHYVCLEQGCGQRTNEDTQLWDGYCKCWKRDGENEAQTRKTQFLSYRSCQEAIFDWKHMCCTTYSMCVLAIIAGQESTQCGLDLNYQIPLKGCFLRM